AEIEPEHVVSARQETRRGQADIGRLGAAFPAVQQQRHAAWLDVRERGVQAKQAHFVAAVDDDLAGPGTDGGQRGASVTPAQQAAGQHRLQVRIAQPAWRAVSAGDRRAHGPARASTMRSRASFAIAARPSAWPGTIGSRNTTSTTRDGSPSRRRKFCAKFSRGWNATARWPSPPAP